MGNDNLYRKGAADLGVDRREGCREEMEGGRGEEREGGVQGGVQGGDGGREGGRERRGEGGRG